MGMLTAVLRGSRNRRGGATFTLLLFVLLLISAGLMYFYFQRCRVLEAELTRWRQGTKARTDAPLQTITAEPEPAVSSADPTLGMPAPPAPKETPETTARASAPPKTAEPKTAEPKATEPMPAPPAATEPSTDHAVIPATAQTPVPDVDAKRVTAPPSGGAPSGAAPASASPQRDKTVAKPPTAAPKRDPKTRSTPIASAYDLPGGTGDSAPADDPGAVRIRVPRRTQQPADQSAPE
jgi:hypothetical protein